MNFFILYLLKVSVSLIVLYAVYYLLFRKETFHQFNRMVLIGNLLLALTLPFLPTPNWLQDLKPNYVSQVQKEKSSISNGTTSNETLDIVTERTQDLTASKTANKISFNYIVLSIYFTGVVIALIWFYMQLLSLVKIISTSKIEIKDGFSLVNVEKELMPFSFFHFIVINPKQFDRQLLNTILTHEQTHVRQLHTVDILLSQLFNIFFWFNPFAWLHQKEIRLNLEYLADKSVADIVRDKKAYQYDLLKMSFSDYQLSLTNNINQSSLKNRITMLNQSSSQTIAKLKYLFLLPVLLLLVSSFSTRNTSVIDFVGSENIYIVITRNTTNTQLAEMVDELSERGVSLKFDFIFRDRLGKISMLYTFLKGFGGECNTSSELDFQAMSMYILGSGEIGCGTKSIDEEIPPKIALELMDKGGIKIVDSKTVFKENSDDLKKVANFNKSFEKKKKEGAGSSTQSSSYNGNNVDKGLYKAEEKLANWKGEVSYLKNGIPVDENILKIAGNKIEQIEIKESFLIDFDNEKKVDGILNIEITMKIQKE